MTVSCCHLLSCMLLVYEQISFVRCFGQIDHHHIRTREEIYLERGIRSVKWQFLLTLRILIMNFKRIDTVCIALMIKELSIVVCLIKLNAISYYSSYQNIHASLVHKLSVSQLFACFT